MSRPRSARLGLGLAAGLLFIAPSLPAQTSGFPSITARQYKSGSAKVTVSGSFQFEAEIPLNTGASISDGESTWLQFGDSGSPEPNALITYGDTKEIGLHVGKGKLGAIGGIVPGEKSECSGTASVTPTEITGEYTCTGVTSYDPSTGKMGTIAYTIRFTAKS